MALRIHLSREGTEIENTVKLVKCWSRTGPNGHIIQPLGWTDGETEVQDVAQLTLEAMLVPQPRFSDPITTGEISILSTAMSSVFLRHT